MHKQVLVEGPSSKKENIVPRHAEPLSNLSLTRFVIEKLPRAAGTAPLKKQWDAQEIEKKWEGSNYAQTREKTIRRRQLSDFERFKVMRLRKQVSCARPRCGCAGLVESAGYDHNLATSWASAYTSLN